MVGLAKARAERSVKGRRKGAVEERVWIPGAEPVVLGLHSGARHLLERIRDEAHRFAITYHRKERGRITSDWTRFRCRRREAEGAPPTFGSVAGVSAASVEQFRSVEDSPDRTWISESLRGGA